MKNPITNPQHRIDQVLYHFDFNTVSKVITALGRESIYTSLTGQQDFSVETLKDFVTMVMNEAFNSYEDSQYESFRYEKGWFWLTIRNYGDEAMVNLSFVIDEMDTVDNDEELSEELMSL